MGGFSQERPIKYINTTKQSTSPGNRQSSWNFRDISVLRVCQVNELGYRENSPEGPVWEAHRSTHAFPMTRRVLTHPSTITSGKSSWAAPAGCLRAERRLWNNVDLQHNLEYKRTTSVRKWKSFFLTRRNQVTGAGVLQAAEGIPCKSLQTRVCPGFSDVFSYPHYLSGWTLPCPL